MYDVFYNLSGRPFQLGPDPRFFVEGPRHKKVLARFLHGIEEGSGFLVLVGEVGTGKSTIAERFLRTLDRSVFLSARIVTSQVDADNLLRMVASAFRLPFEGADKATLIRSIEAFLRECRRHGKRPILTIDEAHNLTAGALEELRMLTNLQQDHQPLLQCLLIGQPEFGHILRREGMEQFRQRIVAACQLLPLDASETQKYIEGRLECVGWQGNPSFTPEAYELIHRWSRGIPRRINLLCGRLLLFGYLEELGQFEMPVVRRVVQELEDESRFEEPDDRIGGIRTQPAPPTMGPIEDDAAPAAPGRGGALGELTRRVANLREA